MGYGRTLGQYRKTEVATAGKMDLVIMCYEKSIQYTKQAKEQYEAGAFENKAKFLQKALDTISELQFCLNFEKGGEIAKNLDAIYSYLTRRLIQGNIEKDYSAFDEAVRLLSELKEAWAGIFSKEKYQTTHNTLSEKVRSIPSQIAA